MTRKFSGRFYMPYLYIETARDVGNAAETNYRIT